LQRELGLVLDGPSEFASLASETISERLTVSQVVLAATIGTVALALLLGALIVSYAQILPAAPWRRVILESLACAAPGMVVWAILAPFASSLLRPVMTPVIGLLAGICCYLVTLVARSAGASLHRNMVYALIWAGTVFTPIAVRTFEPFGTTTPFGLSPIDYGGALVMSVAVGAGMLTILLVERKFLIRGVRMSVSVPAGTISLVVVVLSCCRGSRGWSVLNSLSMPRRVR
jgi:Amt family ammonium transporter